MRDASSISSSPEISWATMLHEWNPNDESIRLPSHLKQGRPFLLDNGLILLYDTTGKGKSAYWDVNMHEVAFEVDMKFGVRTHFELALFCNRYLCAIGHGGGTSVPSYDTLHSKWHPLPKLLNSRVGTTVAVHQNRLYVIGGSQVDGDAIRNVEFLEWRGGSSFVWKRAAPLQKARHRPTVLIVEGKLHVLGGKATSKNQSSIKTMEVYDPETDTWTLEEGVNMLHDRENFCAVAMRREQAILVMGGTKPGTNEVVAEIEVYSFQKKKWAILSMLPSGRKAFSAIAVENSVYLFGGGTEVIDHFMIDEANLFKTANGDSLFRQDQFRNSIPQPSTPMAQRRFSLQRTMSKPKLLPTYERLPEPPVRPRVPKSLTVQDRVKLLENWITQLEFLQQDYEDTIDATVSHIVDSYNTRRDLEIQVVRNKGKSWFDETQRLMDEANQEVAQKKQFLEETKATSDDEREDDPEKKEGSGDDASKAIPNELCCPITLQLMRDPVLASDGNTYERTALERWFMNQPDDKPLSPLTGGVLKGKGYLPNLAIRSLCQQHQA